MLSRAERKRIVKGFALLGVILIIVVVAALAFVAGAITNSRMSNARQRAEVEARERESALQEARIRMLGVTRRVARLYMTRIPDRNGVAWHHFRFQEYDGGIPIGPATEDDMAGNRVFVQAFLLRFRQQQAGQTLGPTDPPGGGSVLMFRRFYTGSMAPASGRVIDAVGARPLIYAPLTAPGNGRQANPTDPELALFRQIWDIIESSERQQAAGIAAANSAAEGKPVDTTVYYEAELDAFGGLLLRPVPLNRNNGPAAPVAQRGPAADPTAVAFNGPSDGAGHDHSAARNADPSGLQLLNTPVR